MNIEAFAEAERLRVRRDEDNTRIIPGKDGHVWQYDEDTLAVTLLELKPRAWTLRKQACLAVGMEVTQDGDNEGTCLFDPTDSEQVRVALKVAQAKRKRVLSQDQRAALLEAGAGTRFQPTTALEGPLTAKNRRAGEGEGSGKGEGSEGVFSAVRDPGREAA
jgi:hypothetical protein